MESLTFRNESARRAALLLSLGAMSSTGCETENEVDHTRDRLSDTLAAHELTPVVLGADWTQYEDGEVAYHYLDHPQGQSYFDVEDDNAIPESFMSPGPLRPSVFFDDNGIDLKPLHWPNYFSDPDPSAVYLMRGTEPYARQTTEPSGSIVTEFAPDKYGYGSVCVLKPGERGLGKCTQERPSFFGPGDTIRTR